MLKTIGQQAVYTIINPFVKMLIALKITPNMITTMGLILNMVAAGIFIFGAEFGKRGDLSFVGWGGFTILFAGLFDMIDGRLARLAKMESTFGAFYDSVLDRYSELIMFLGICYYLISQHYFLSSLFAFVALIGSMMVSYTRARAEGLGIDCGVGMMQRPERIVIIGGSALICGIVSFFIGGDFKIESPFIEFPYFESISIFTLPVTVVAILSNYTAFQRVEHSRNVLEKREQK